MKSHVGIENATRHPVQNTSLERHFEWPKVRVTDLAKSQTVNNRENAIDAEIYRSWSTEVTPIGIWL